MNVFGDVFINGSGAFFPNSPVDNENIEKVLGEYRGKSSKSKTIVLASNQIKTRHYAVDPVSRQPTHSNAEITALAVGDLFSRHPNLSLKEVRLLACGTSSPDLLVPSHGQMVQGLIPELSCEVISTAGVCCSSMAALRFAHLSLGSGDHERAVVTGSETAGKYMRSEFLESESDERLNELKNNSYLAFDHDFLRWMLSDGAAALHLSRTINKGQTNLKINWIEGRSFANEIGVCMYAGGYKNSDGTITPWKDLRLEPDSARTKYVMNLHQDIRMLKEKIPYFGVQRPLGEIKKKRALMPGDYSWLLPHYSSHFFKPILENAMIEVDFAIPPAKWFTSLYDRGNIGSASIFATLHDLINSKSLKQGEKILCFVPESARFSVYFMELEVV
jgi:3-oxoacyl-[acyl-carrier-protein] synthase III